MLVLSKNKRNIINQVTISDQTISLINCKLNNKMNLNKSKNKTKNRRTGSALKFHNFVANCAVSNSNGSTSKETTNETTHCLKEEHGTKQITVSHWRKSISSLDPNLVSTDSITNNPHNNPPNNPSNNPFNSSIDSSSNSVANNSSLMKNSSPIIKNDQSSSDQEIKNSKVSKAKSFSLLSNSNSLISRSDFTLPINQSSSDPNQNLLIKNLISNNSLQYFNGKQKHLNLKQSSSKALSSSLANRSSPTLFKNKSTNFRLNNQLKSKGQHMTYDKIQSNSNQQSTDQLNNQLTRQLNKFYNKLNINQLTEANLSSLNLKQSIDQLNLILNDNNLLNVNESILSNLLIKETVDSANASSTINRDCSSDDKNKLIDHNKLLDNRTVSLPKSIDNRTISLDKSIDSNKPNSDKQIKTSRRKPIFVRRLIKVETDDPIRNKDESINCEQPLDLSLKKRKLSTHSIDSVEKSINLDELDKLGNDNSFLGKQSTNDSVK